MGAALPPIRLYHKKRCGCRRPHLAVNQYVVWYSLNRDPKYFLGTPADRIRMGLAYTDCDGFLHPVTWKDANGTVHNQVVIGRSGGASGELLLEVRNFKPWWQVVKNSMAKWAYRRELIKVHPRKDFGLFLWTPNLRYMSRQLSLKKLRRQKLLCGCKHTEIGAFLKKRKPWVPLHVPCSYPLYYLHTKRLVRVLERLLKNAARRLGNLTACAALVDQAANLNAGWGSYRYDRWLRNVYSGNTAKAVGCYHETLLLRKELMEPLGKKIKQRYAYFAKRYYGRRISWVARRLREVLCCRDHHEQFEKFFDKSYEQRYLKASRRGKDYIPYKYRRVYRQAYALLARTDEADTIYRLHVGKFLSSTQTAVKSNQQLFDEAVRKGVEWSKTNAGWLRKLRSGWIDIASSFGTLKLGRELSQLRTDLVAATAFLESVQEAKPQAAARLQKQLFSLRLVDQRVDATDFFNQADDHISMKAFNAAVSGLKLASIMLDTNKRQTMVQKIENAKTIAEVGLELTQFKGIQTYMPGAKVIKKGGGLLTAGVDFGLAIHALYSTAGKANGTDFHYAVGSYCGKGFVMGGLTVALLPPLAPFGLALAAVGGAIDILTDVAKACRDYKSPHLQKFEHTLKSLLKRDKRIYRWYQQFNDSVARNTPYATSFVQSHADGETRNRQSINSAWSGMTVGQVAQKYFNDAEWGLGREYAKPSAMDKVRARKRSA